MKKVVATLLLSIATLNAQAADNLTLQKAKEAGIKDCLKAVEGVSSFVVADNTHGVHAIWNKEHPNETGFSSMIETNYNDGTIVTNVNVTKAASGECFVEYVKVVHYAKSCMAVAKNWEKAVYKGELNKEVAYLSDGSSSIYLLPAGSSGCVMLRKEIVMDGRQP